MKRCVRRIWAANSPLSEYKILKVANFLDVSVDYFLGNTNNRQSHKSKEDFSFAAKELSEAAAKMTASAAQAEGEIQTILEKYKLSPPAHL